MKEPLLVFDPHDGTGINRYLDFATTLIRCLGLLIILFLYHVFRMSKYSVYSGARLESPKSLGLESADLIGGGLRVSVAGQLVV